MHNASLGAQFCRCDQSPLSGSRSRARSAQAADRMAGAGPVACSIVSRLRVGAGDKRLGGWAERRHRTTNPGKRQGRSLCLQLCVLAGAAPSLLAHMVGMPPPHGWLLLAMPGLAPAVRLQPFGLPFASTAPRGMRYSYWCHRPPLQELPSASRPRVERAGSLRRSGGLGDQLLDVSHPPSRRTTDLDGRRQVALADLAPDR